MKSVTFRSIGTITGPHGLRGDVLLKPCDEDMAWLGRVDSVYVIKPQGPVEMQIQSAQEYGKKVILKLQAVDDRTMAEALQGCEVKLPENVLPPLEADEFYADTLIGMAVKSRDSGEALGVVEDVLSSDAGDFLEVSAPHLPEPVLVPFRHTFVPTVDAEAGTVYITGLDSLFAGESE